MADFIDNIPTKSEQASANDSPASTTTPTDATAIRPGAIVKLSVPREDIGAEITPSEELVSNTSVKIARVTQEGWFLLNRGSELTTRLLCYKPKPDAYDEEYYFVDPALRPALHDAMRDVRVFMLYSIRSKVNRLWVVKVNPGMPAYESLERLLNLDQSFIATRQIRVKWDRDKSRYIVLHRAASTMPEWLEDTTEDLLGAALGESHFILSTEHAIYAELSGGEEL